MRELIDVPNNSILILDEDESSVQSGKAKSKIIMLRRKCL